MHELKGSNFEEKNVILMILNQNFPDVRVCQEIDALSKSGYEVYVVVPITKGNSSPEYQVDNYNLIEINLHTNKFDKLMSLMKFYNTKILNRIINNIIFKSVESRIIAVHAHDLLWCKLSLQLAKVLDVKFIVDYHENYPALNEFFDVKREKTFKDFLIRNFNNKKRLVKYERKMTEIADKVIVVAEENSKRLIENYNFDISKIHVVSNTKNPEKYLFYGVNEESKINILYHGSIQKLRGLRTLIDAFIESKNNNLTLTIIGFKPDCVEKKYILNRLKNKNIKSVELIDWTEDRELVLDKIKRSDIGVIPHDYSELGQTTVPNKIFEYMCHGKPLIVSSLRPLKRIVENSNNGFIFEAGSVKALSSILDNITNKKMLLELSENSRKSAEVKYNWESDSNELIKLYGDLK